MVRVPSAISVFVPVVSNPTLESIKKLSPDDKAIAPFVAIDQNEKKVLVLFFPPLSVSTSIKSA